MQPDSMPAPHYKQSQPGACLQASIRMVLADWEDHRTEDEISKILGSYPFGTPSSRVNRLSQIGYHVQYGPANLSDLINALSQNLYPIVFVSAEMLPWVDFDGFHALVITRITNKNVFLNDPSQETYPHQLSKDGFLIAWTEFDQLCAIIPKPT